MKRAIWFAVLAGILLAAALMLVYWLGAPRLLSVSPADGDSGVPASTAVELNFSRSMQVDTVIQRLSIEPQVPGAFAWLEDTLVFSPNDPWPAGETIKVQLEPGGRTQGALSFSMRAGLEWTFTIGQPRLAYIFMSSTRYRALAID